MEINDRYENMRYLLMAKSAEEGKKYLDNNKKELKEYMKLGYAVVCIGGYFMANEEAEPEKIAFILAIKINCLPCIIYEKCMSNTIADGCREIEKLEDGILALEPNIRSVEYH